jgi:putative SOS response-associated peptidase YedK
MASPIAPYWRSPVRERVHSFAIITTRANELCAELHDQMAVILSSQSWPAWLGKEPAHPSCLKDARAIPVGRDDWLAGEFAGRERQEQ